MERYRGLVMLIAALLLAVVTTFVVYRWQQRPRARPDMVARELMQPVVVAGADLCLGTKLSPHLLKVVLLPKDSLPEKIYGSIEQVQDRVLIISVVTNEPILKSKLAPEGTLAGLQGVIETDKRAMSVRVDEVVGVAGFIYPGSRVDVLVTIKPLRSEKGPVSKIILQDVPVLTAGTRMEVKEGGKAVPVSVVTLEVTPEDAEKLALAATKGKIRLALRSQRDSGKKDVETKGIITEDLIARARPISRPRPVKKGTRKFVVEVIRGSDVSSQTF